MCAKRRCEGENKKGKERSYEGGREKKRGRKKKRKKEEKCVCIDIIYCFVGKFGRKEVLKDRR
jgi:hypothetical protein